MLKTLLSSGLMRQRAEEYQGMHIGCAPGTHAGLVEAVTRIMQARGGVLDIGAHSGALLLRLRNAGFTDLHAADLDPTVFKLTDVPHTVINANEPFAAKFGRTFNLITCTDVVEHLDSPRQFFLEAHKLLADGGYLAFSVPNVAFWEGRIKFAMTGELWGFGRRNYVWQRHISPMTVDQADLMLQEVGYKTAAWRTAGTFATTLRQIVLAPLWLPFVAVNGGSCFGESLIFVARKAEPDAQLRKPKDYIERWGTAA